MTERPDTAYSQEEREARDSSFKASDGCTVRDGLVWDEAWHAAREFYAPNADEANRLRQRVIPIEGGAWGGVGVRLPDVDGLDG